ncbi:MAG: hypothetical protein KGJ41_08705 [Rhodospirillales bacterium]|nr:hypothetical protein [Rhodospirillales bacterium]MDE2199090.1 hypothetical protein [Rhodospirillales bacterium]MDE2576188.1 hypothetical protein [Rhodospirillales bacterium]
MPRYSKRQQEPKSCGAATLLVTLKELTGAPAKTTNTEEDAIYQAVKIPSGSLGAGETLPSSVYAYALGKNLHAEIIESPQTAGAFATKPMYQLYSYALGQAGIHPSVRELADADFAGNARLFLVVKFASSDLTHYVLARKDGAAVYIMNPDPGSDEAMALPAFGAAVSTNRGGVIIHTPTGTANDGASRDYTFTGIAVRVWS